MPRVRYPLKWRMPNPLFFAVLVSLLAGCASLPNTLQPRLAREIDAAVAAEMERQQLVGVAVGVLRENRIVYLKGYGLADREKQIPVSRRSMFRWASISKPLTAIAALQLEEDAQLDLRANVRKYVPEFQNKNATVTSRDLLCHQGGIVHYTNGPVIATPRIYREAHPFANVIHGLDTFRESPLVNSPGAKFAYTTKGYMLLSAVVERAGKKSFADQVRDRIANPLGMRTLQPDYQWRDISGRVVGYRKVDGRIIRSTNTDVSWKLGGGGYISNIEDLARFAEGLLNRRLVTAEMEQRMWTPQLLSDGKPTRYGLGFSILGTGPDRVVGHGGAQEKTRTRLALLPAKKLGIVLMSNSEHCDTTAFTIRLLKTLGVNPPTPPR